MLCKHERSEIPGSSTFPTVPHSASLHAGYELLLDCRVKPGNDGGESCCAPPVKPPFVPLPDDVRRVGAVLRPSGGLRFANPPYKLAPLIESNHTTSAAFSLPLRERVPSE
jgi:hypothetical protein